MKKIMAADLAAFKDYVEDEILPLLKPKTLFLLSGELGAGKTELVKTIAQIHNMQDVQSPTFSFHLIYKSNHMQMHHVDLYRLKGEEDLESTGFWDLFENENDIIFVEWANLIQKDSWPWGWTQIYLNIKKTGESSREILITQPQE